MMGRMIGTATECTTVGGCRSEARSVPLDYMTYKARLCLIYLEAV